MERKILSAILHDRAVYEQIKGLINETDLSDQGYIVYKTASDYYENDAQAALVDTDLLCEVFSQKYEKHSKRLSSLVKDLEPVSVPNVLQTFLDLKKNKAGLALSHALASGNEFEIERNLEQYVNIKSSDKEEENQHTFIGYSINNIMTHVSRENLIRLWPKSLNERMEGGVPKGTHILIFARPEVGKSLFSINMACGFLRDGYRVLYIGNEDPYAMMLLRFFSNLSGLTRAEIQADPYRAEQIAKERGYENLVFASLAPGTIKEIRGLIRSQRPDVLIVDQLPNLFAGNLNKVEKLEYLASEVRSLGKDNDLVTVSVCQAADSAQGKLVLDMGDVYYSNTGIPAQVDVMIGMGMDGLHEAQDTRMLSLCKNKITGNHESFMVKVNRQLTKVQSV